MWIRELAVDDFGHLHKVSVGGLSGGMNVVLGPNESGKTTLLHFLRWVLFGFPHGNTDAVRRYRPPSGHFGGRLRVERDRSAREPNAPAPTSMLLERHYGDEDPLITTADGATAPPGALFELVGSAGLELFETVFAITTDELSDFQGLDTHEVREQIYAAGIVGRGRSARRVIESLEQRRHALLGPRSGRIRELHRELQRRREELAGATTAAEGLPARRDELDRLGRDVAAADARRLALLARCEQLAKVIAIWPHWLAAESAREELVSLGPELELPADPRGTLEALRERLDEATAALEQAEADLERTERRVEQVEVDDRLAALAPRIRDLDRLSTLAEQRDGRIATLRVQVQDLRSRRDEQLADLGPGWTPRGALAVDVSMPRVGAVRELASACTEVDRELRATRAELEEARRTHDILSAEVGTLEATSLEVRSRVGTELDKNSALAASLQLQGLLAELGRAESAASGDARYAELVRELTERGHRAAVPPLLFPALVATSAACAGGSAIAFLVESPIAAILLAAAAVASLVLALVARSGPRPRALRTPELDTDDAGADRLRQLRHRVATLSATCGLPRLPSAEQVAERRGELERLTRCETDLAAHRARLASLSDAVRSARSRNDAARDELLALERSWAELRGAIGLPEQVQLAEAVALLDRLRTARNTARDLEGRASELGELEAAQRRYVEEVAELMEAAGLDGANATGGAGIALLAEGLRGDEEDRRRLRELQRQRAGRPPNSSSVRCDGATLTPVGWPSLHARRARRARTTTSHSWNRRPAGPR
ncbi:MAG: AAA family ATPase [Microthrixaceae bacterium]